MKIKTVVVGMLNTNCYILQKENNILIIDPGDESEKIINEIDGNVVGIIITHSHDDHIGALKSLIEKYNCNFYNYTNLKEGINNVANFNFEVIYTPGHKADLVTIYFEKEKVMFVGDFIFKGNIGRYDFIDSSIPDMKKSIKKILKYDDDIIIYPGHFLPTSIKDERKNLEYYYDFL